MNATPGLSSPQVESAPDLAASGVRVAASPNQRGFEARFTSRSRTAFAGIEEALYIVIALVLVGAAVYIIAGTVSGLISATRRHQSAVNTGILLLDRILLMLIVAELLHTLRFVVLRGTIIVEPFLFVGLIAVVRRVLIVTAELENNAPAGRALTNQLLQLGLLGFLALALAVAIFLVRRGGPAGYDPAQGSV
jgi:uncharacterized membrane protein (DUF373 family)